MVFSFKFREWVSFRRELIVYVMNEGILCLEGVVFGIGGYFFFIKLKEGFSYYKMIKKEVKW